MSSYTIKVTIKGTGKLWSVKFFPEKNEDFDIFWHRGNGFTLYTSDEITVDVDGDFDFKIVVGARNTIKYDYTVSVKSGAQWVDVVKGTRQVRNHNTDTFESSVAIPATIIPESPIV